MYVGVGTYKGNIMWFDNLPLSRKLAVGWVMITVAYILGVTVKGCSV